MREERRSQPRYRFTAAATLLEKKSGTQIEVRIADISPFAVNAHGASIPLFASVKNGQRLKLVNPATGDEAECIVAHVGRRHADRMEVGVFFAFANPKFWHVIFPPQDWTAP